jgi:hypothetical protein
MGFLTGAVNETPELLKDITIADKFVVTIKWLAPKERDAILKQCTEYKRGMPDVNRDRHARAYTKRVVRGWRGLTVDTLTGPLKVQIFDHALEAVQKVAKENGGELPFNQEDSVLIYLNALPDRYANKIREAMEDWDDDVDKYEADVEKK